MRISLFVILKVANVGQRSNFQNLCRRLKLYSYDGQDVLNILINANISVCNFEGHKCRSKVKFSKSLQKAETL